MTLPFRRRLVGRRTGSRLAKQQQGKAVRQAILYFGLAITLGFLFFRFLLPITLDFFFAVLNPQQAWQPADEIPPQPPIFSQAPPQATNQTSIELTGFGEPGSLVILLMNKARVAEITVDEQGDFSHSLSLQEGVYTVQAFSVDAAGNESRLSREFVMRVDTTVPTLNIEQPVDGQSIELLRNQQTTIIGTTEPEAVVTINGRRTRADNEGTFSTTYQLQEGDNTLTITAEDLAGNSTETTVEVSFQI